MGSFNTTCSISRLPIGIGDEVKLFFIVKNPYNDSINCYTNNSWNIFGLPLDAVYDDYGRYKLIETEQNISIWEVYKRNFEERILEVSKGERYRECGVSKTNITFDNLQDAIWENHAKLVHTFFDDPEKHLTIQVMAVHKTVYEHMSTSYTYWNGTIDANETTEKVLSHELCESFLTYKDIIESYNEDSLEVDENGELTKESENICDLYYRILWMVDFYETPEMYEKNGISLNCNKSIYHLVKYELNEYITFCSELIRKYIFECNMQQLNIQVQPIMTSGQDYHFQTHIQLHEMIVELSKEKHNEHDNWDE
ncbi:hypothetical protein [Yersinia phage fHe-Yen9-04]|uniref:Phage protein n=1 Tax=Yersinia phage fHe-Yen9-04 TaxID=2052742 RepID=A0A2C9CX32_9CAUD|nr:hypothetical protein FDJ41_gp100 [Yersinia phage fHe-Yen9-04]SOK58377.1 hypothetical protein [Yersinia phage fHe-Yen9-04]VUE36146.1 hypothetical protein [Yersinia phage fHe-Yen9-04]